MIFSWFSNEQIEQPAWKEIIAVVQQNSSQTSGEAVHERCHFSESFGVLVTSGRPSTSVQWQKLSTSMYKEANSLCLFSHVDILQVGPIKFSSFRLDVASYVLELARPKILIIPSNLCYLGKVGIVCAFVTLLKSVMAELPHLDVVKGVHHSCHQEQN